MTRFPQLSRLGPASIHLAGGTWSASASLALATLLWAGNFAAGRALRDELDPVALNFWRWGLALVVLLPCTATALRRQLPLLRQHLRYVAALALSCIVVPHICIYQALRSTSIVNALLLLNLVPLAVAVAGRLLYGQRLQGQAWAGIALAGAAAALLVTRADPRLLSNFELSSGELWMGPAVIAGAGHALLLRRAPAGLDQGVLLTAAAALALLLMLPWLLATGGWNLPRSPALLGGLAYMGVAAAALAFLLWNRAAAQVGPHRAAPFMYLMPVWGALLSIVLLGETLLPVQWVTGAVLLAGLWLSWRSGTAARSRP